MDAVPGDATRVGAASLKVISGEPSRSTWMATGEAPVTFMVSVWLCPAATPVFAPVRMATTPPALRWSRTWRR